MEQIVFALAAEMEAALQEISQEENRVLRYERSIRQVRGIIDRLKEWLAAHPFPGRAEEVRYFKVLAPKFYSRLFYFMKLYQVEAYRPYGGAEKFRGLLEEELKGIERFYAQHEEICLYYSRQADYWDDYLFTRKDQGEWSPEEAGIFIEENFCMGCYWASWILANERYREWLRENLAEGSGEGKERKLVWKAGKTALVETAWALYVSKSFGDATFKDVIELFQPTSETEIKHYFATVQEIERRKKGRTKHLDYMVERVNASAEERLEP